MEHLFSGDAPLFTASIKILVVHYRENQVSSLTDMLNTSKFHIAKMNDLLLFTLVLLFGSCQNPISNTGTKVNKLPMDFYIWQVGA